MSFARHWFCGIAENLLMTFIVILVSSHYKYMNVPPSTEKSRTTLPSVHASGVLPLSRGLYSIRLEAAYGLAQKITSLCLKSRMYIVQRLPKILTNGLKLLWLILQILQGIFKLILMMSTYLSHQNIIQLALPYSELCFHSLFTLITLNSQPYTLILRLNNIASNSAFFSILLSIS